MQRQITADSRLKANIQYVQFKAGNKKQRSKVLKMYTL